MDIYQEQIASNIEAQLMSAGMTLSQLVQFYGSKNSALLNLSAEQYAQFSRYYDLLIAQDYSTFSKGKLLENITSVLFQNSLFIFAETVELAQTSLIYSLNGVKFLGCP